MKSVSINGIARVDLGKKFAKQLRKENNVPCVIYGGTENPVHFYAHENEFRKIVYTPNVYLIDVIIGDDTYKVIMGDLQFHPVTDSILHIDFLRIFENKNVKLNIPVNIIGNSIGVRNGGRLSLNMRRMLVEGLSENLPGTIEIDITNLRIGDSIRVADVTRENITFLNNSDDVIVAVKTARAAIAEEEEEEEASASEEGGDTSTEEAKSTEES
ncbi:MAG: 50S ribosomal protein L25/general stress protein Ctc [Flavobacteriales bacterium]|nr:50S ribosomal protein L25/general stress protein Ctc [Flavobacteriales bacterium]|tara:strand:+ start:1316 stop:1957 length:642 start_codon:yes stop_codon:yes gene_type:complete